MELVVEVTSTETIKPSSPTPHHLRHFRFSFLDRLAPPVYSPLVFFYQADKNNREITNNVKIASHLKRSLSKVLTSFYPLAGRNKDNCSIDCNDQGVLFVEATVNCPLSQITENPVPAQLNKLLPFELDDPQELVLGIQFNSFKCGGTAIGVCISHNIADAASVFTFVKSWAASTRGDGDLVRVEFASDTVFPPRNSSGFQTRSGITKENIVAKRFVFSASEIEAIRDKYTAYSTNQERPSRVEALSAFIWSRFVAATKAESASDDKLYSLLHAVNLRSRTEPPLPDYSFGNLFRMAVIFPSTDDTGDRVVTQMRESKNMIDKEYVKRIQKGNEHLEFLKNRSEKINKGEMVGLSFTSLCGFPLYEGDFGWGKPLWVTCAKMTYKNLVVFMDSLSGNGIEVLIHLNQRDMGKFDSQWQSHHRTQVAHAVHGSRL
ncbi:hypothetical protein Ddye_031720 [Dipteronia dyeriana]|uniref:Uncharacterized protein n=1 Tax=Dipteronia dyeriana TaxID=168575 RepID=A0AAD9TJF6_9ROSI|nr:hypothetical protein Ddye_031720 [Dipteronia dyeriana]